MKPWGFVFGALTGAAATLILTQRDGAKRARPAAKAALKAAMMALHEARAQGAELMESAEDLLAEVRAEATQEIFMAAMAAAQAEAKAAGEAKAAKEAKATEAAATQYQEKAEGQSEPPLT